MRLSKNIHVTILFFCVCLTASAAFGQPAIPDLWGLRVHDEAHVLSERFVNSLEQKLAAYQDSTSNQIAVLTIPTLDGDVLEDYSLRVAEKWQLGLKDKDNGALLLIVTQDHKMRIETGYGLEGVLPDAVCAEIIRNEIAPNFRRNDYDTGVEAGIVAMTQAIGGEYIVSAGNENGAVQVMTWKEKALVGLFVFGLLGIFTFLGLASKGRVSWFLYVFLTPFYAAFPSAIFGWGVGRYILFSYLGGYILLKLLVFKNKDWINWQNRGGGGGGWSGGSGWMGGGGGGWSSGGGGGGFSGGGGSFGGGGSSGSW